VHRAFITYLLVLLAVAVVMGVDALLTIVYVVAAVYLLARLWFARALPRLAVERRLTDRAFPGDTVEVELAIENTGRLPIPWVEVHERLPTALAMPPAHREAVALPAGAGPGPPPPWRVVPTDGARVPRSACGTARCPSPSGSSTDDDADRPA
jgi:uncharacterized protein (DUF58 family)